MEHSNPENQPYSLSQDLEQTIIYDEASVGQRFLNFLIDNLLMQYGLSYITGTAVGYLLVAVAPDLTYDLFAGDNNLNMLILAYILGVFNYLIYYTFCEKLFRGYTLGKLVTGTRCIREDGEELTFKNAILRSLSRLVPFEPFSAFNGNPWHDVWTKTKVIKVR